ncbi:MAG: apolipoprotein N-acyltransferase [Acidobacteria bacterium]|nr:MAG: apolipoprotein N-acyltransferase [Acidobacteriota bacterium]
MSRTPPDRPGVAAVRAGGARPWLLAAGAGVAMALALPGPGLVPLVLVVPGLLRRALAGARGWRAFRIGWLAGFAQWGVAVAWVFIVLHRYGHLHAALAVLAVALMAAILGTTWAIAGWAASRLSEGLRIVALPLALAAFEELQRFPPWIFPWNPAAAALTPVPVLLTPLPVTATIGLSLLVFLAGSALDALLAPGLRRAGAVWLAVAVAGWSGAALAAPAFHPAGAAVKVAALQPNVPLESRWNPANEESIEDRVWRLSRRGAEAGARWIVWPESAVPRVLESDAAFRHEVEAFTRTRGVWLLFGSIGLGTGEDQYYNSVYVASPAGLLPWRYDKVHLVPFGEYVPLVGRIAALRPLVRGVGSFTPGTHVQPLPGPAGPVGVAVCYEVAYPSLYASEVVRGAAVLATITNDGWYGDSAAPRQHLALAILRAAEARRFLVRAANTGISAVIDPYGRLVTRLGFGREGLITAEVRPGSDVTPAVAYGGGIRAAVVLVAAGVMILGTRRQSGLAGPLRSRRREEAPCSKTS